MADDLNREIAALKELGRNEEAASVQVSLDSVYVRMSEIQPSDIGSAGTKTPLEGAVTVEINHPNGQKHLRSDINFKKLERSLMYDAEEEKIGHLSGVISVPENTTLIFDGNDSEALYRALEPRLHSNPLLKGALITIRQRDTKREIVIPSDATQVN